MWSVHTVKQCYGELHQECCFFFAHTLSRIQPMYVEKAFAFCSPTLMLSRQTWLWPHTLRDILTEEHYFQICCPWSTLEPNRNAPDVAGVTADDTGEVYMLGYCHKERFISELRAWSWCMMRGEITRFFCSSPLIAFSANRIGGLRHFRVLLHDVSYNMSHFWPSNSSWLWRYQDRIFMLKVRHVFFLDEWWVEVIMPKIGNFHGTTVIEICSRVNSSAQNTVVCSVALRLMSTRWYWLYK